MGWIIFVEVKLHISCSFFVIHHGCICLYTVQLELLCEPTQNRPDGLMCLYPRKTQLSMILFATVALQLKPGMNEVTVC